MSQQGVALAQAAMNVQPSPMEPMFHVEHSPIEKLSPHLGPTHQQIEGVGIDQLQRQPASQFGRIPDRLPLDPSGEAAVARARHTNGDRCPVTPFTQQRGEHREVDSRRGGLRDRGGARETIGRNRARTPPPVRWSCRCHSGRTEGHAPQFELRLLYVPELTDAQPPNGHSLVVRLRVASASRRTVHPLGPDPAPARCGCHPKAGTALPRC